MKQVKINLSWGREQIHRALKYGLSFPDYYGNNLDALYDVLTESSEEIEISISGNGEYGNKVRDAIIDAAQINDKIYIVEMGNVNMNQAKEKFYTLQAKLAAYNHAVAALYFDGNTRAPKGTSENLAVTMSVLGEEIYKLSTGKDTVELLEYLDANKAELAEKEVRMVFLMLKNIRQLEKIPMDEYVKMQKLMVESENVWHIAKEADDFAMFLPYLEQVFETRKKIAAWCAPDKDPYDYWLSEFEDGLDRAKCDEFFAVLRGRIVPLLEKISKKEQLSDRCIRGDFPVALQEQLSEYIMDVMGIDKNHCGIATTEHPYTTTMGSHHDVRITTKYHPDDYSNSLFSVAHEGGHALYELNVSDELEYTVLDGGVSMGIHESQSRFYENYIGRSREFIDLIYPKITEIFGERLKGYTSEDLYKAVNRAQPGLIRIEADELTYALHVMVRYELEKAVFAGTLQVKDLADEWKRKYKEYLGVDVPNDRQGVLQDSHWSAGNIGYFPSYALGSAYGAQFFKKMKATVDVNACIKSGDLSPINEWNRENIWQYGQLYAPGVLLEKVLGEKFDPTVFCGYLEEKYTELYNL